MNEIRELLSGLAQRGIKFTLEDVTLKTRAPPGSIDDGVAALIRAHKQDIIHFLQARAERDDILACDPHMRIPASLSQQRLWLSDQIHDPRAHTLCTALRIQGKVNRPRLQRALDTIVNRHPALRTVLEHVDGQLFQRVLPFAPLDIQQQDLRALDGSARHAQAAAQRRRFEALPFDLGVDRMMRAQLLRLDEETWLLLLAVHHVAMDDWSLDIFLHEFSTLYAADDPDESNDPPALPSLPVTYADFSCWQLARSRRPRWQAQLAYWRQHLAGIPATHAIPLDFPRPRTMGISAFQVAAHLDASVVSRLKSVARAHDATLFMVIHAALATVISCWSGEQDIVIGTPVSGRTHAKLTGLIGYFSNTLALRTQLDPGMSLSQLLRFNREQCLQAYEHQEASFDAVLDALRPPRDPAYAPVFQIFLSMPQRHLRSFSSSGVSMKCLPQEGHTCAFDFDIAVCEADNGLTIEWNADDALFERPSVERLVRAYLSALSAFADDPHSRIQDLALFDATDEATLTAWNGQTIACPHTSPVHTLVEAQASRIPEKTALVFGATHVSYRSLNGRANALAAQLAAAGAGPGCFVAVIMPACIEVPLSFLAIMKSGAAFAPLDSDWPEERLTAALDRLAPVMVLHLASTTQRWAWPSLQVDWRQLPLQADGRKATSVDAPIYAMHTSGSTGTPKAAVNLHSGILNRLAYMDRCFGTQADDVVLQTTHHCFDSAVWQFFWPLSRGGICVMREPALYTDPEHLRDQITRHGVTLTDFTPTLLEVFTRHLQRRRDDSPLLLKHLIVGGEAMTSALAKACAQVLQHTRLHNFYGPTETSIGCVHHVLACPAGTRVPIGRPIENVVLAVVDPFLRPQPIGAPGELLIGGACLGLGYVADAPATARAFVTLPSPLFGQSRFYRSGDRVRWRADGELDYLGRIDDQIKLRGFRIEPGDICAVLQAHPDVQQAHVLALGEGSARQLVAFVVAPAATASEAFITTLQAEAARALPEVMRPSGYVLVDAIPLLASGKADRRALSALACAPRTALPRSPPGNATERLVAEVWATHLGRIDQDLSMTDNFFEIGGNSLLIIAVQHDLQHRFSVTLGVADLFSHPTPRQLAQLIEERRAIAHSRIDVNQH